MADDERSRPAQRPKGTRRTPDVIATPPHLRHGVATFSARSWNRKRNTLIEPWVDVDRDIAAINAGEGIHDPGTRQTWVNGRLYGMHENGTTFPIEGEGIITVNRGTFRALQAYRQYNGVNERSERELDYEKGVTSEDRISAQRIWRMREEARGNAADDRD